MPIIPTITAPLGKDWKQPTIDEIVVDNEVAMMTQETFDLLAEYSLSIPTGKIPGKMWKTFTGKGWYLRWYRDELQADEYIYIESRRIVLL